MSCLVGYRYCKLDSKGRLMFPAEFKEQMGEQAEEGFVLRPAVSKKCLELYTHREWEAVQTKMREKFNLFDEVHMNAMRDYNNSSHPAKLDATGRIQIPKDLIDLGIISKDVVVEPVANRIEIWDKARFDASMAAIDNAEVMELFKEFLK